VGLRFRGVFGSRRAENWFSRRPQLGPNRRDIPLTWLRSNLLLKRAGRAASGLQTWSTDAKEIVRHTIGDGNSIKGGRQKSNEEANHHYAPRPERHDTAAGTTTGTYEEQSIKFLVFN